MGFDTVNGCGACSGFWKWFKPPHYKFFKEECNRHDLAYDIGTTKIDRLVADLVLLQDMKVKSKVYYHRRKFISKCWFIILCYIYFIGLRLLGPLPINRNKSIIKNTINYGKSVVGVVRKDF